MRIDWVVALVIFLMFAGWAFAYHSLFSAGQLVSRSGSASLAGEKILDYMQVHVSSIPASISSASPTGEITLWAYTNWSGSGQNSTRVVQQRLSNESMPCSVSGNGVYWNASLAAGDNFFFIENAGMDTPLNCGQGVPQTQDNQTVLWAAEMVDMFSTARNAQVCGQMNSSYANTKSEIGVAFDFNVLLEGAGSVLTCGPNVPRAGREVYVYPASGSLFEGGKINISVRLW